MNSGPVSGYGACVRRNDELRDRNDQGMSRMTNERLLERSIRIGVRDMLSYQSPMPAGAGTPRCENGGLVAGSVWASLAAPLRLPWIPAFAE